MHSRVFTKDMLTRPIEISVQDEALTLVGAMEIAGAKAAELLADPMLLAWYNAKTGEFSPRVE